MVHVNYLAVLVAALAVFVLGWLWYSPLLFYKPWMRAKGIDPAVAMAGAKPHRVRSVGECPGKSGRDSRG